LSGNGLIGPAVQKCWQPLCRWAGRTTAMPDVSSSVEGFAPVKFMLVLVAPIKTPRFIS